MGQGLYVASEGGSKLATSVRDLVRQDIFRLNSRLAALGGAIAQGNERIELIKQRKEAHTSSDKVQFPPFYFDLLMEIYSAANQTFDVQRSMTFMDIIAAGYPIILQNADQQKALLILAKKLGVPKEVEISMCTQDMVDKYIDENSSMLHLTG